MKLIKIATAAISIFALSSLVVFSADTINVNVNRDTGEVHIYGFVDGKTKGNVTLVVDNPNGSVQPYNHIEQQGIDKGEYSFKYKCDTVTNTVFKARVSYFENSIVLEKSFKIFDNETKGNFIQDINSAADENTIIGLINDNNDFIFDAGTSFSALSADGKIAVAADIYKNRPYESAQSIINTVCNMYFAQMIYEVSGSENKYNILKSSFTRFNLTELDEYKYLCSKDIDFGKRVADKMSKVRITSSDKIADAFCGGVLLVQIDDSENKSEVRSFLINSVFELARYRGLSETGNIDESFKGRSFDTVEDLEKEIDRLIDNIPQVKKPTEKKAGGGGPSGKVEFKTDIPTDEPTKAETKIMFADVAESHWGYNSIKILQAKGVLSGDEKGNFRPDDNVTRAEFLKIMLESLKLVDSTAKCSFSDVPADNWSYAYVATAQKYGLVSGRDGNVFDLDSFITREEAFHIIYKALIFKGCSLKAQQEFAGFADESTVESYAYESVKSLYQAGIINGSGDNLLTPKNCITRAEAAKTIYAVLQKLN